MSFKDVEDGQVRIVESGYTQNTNKLLGRSTAAPGAIEEIAIGSALSLTNKTLDVSATAGLGTVTSVGLALPTSVFDISGSPVTTSGTLTGTFDTQSANTFFAGPTSGGAATPAFRGPLVTADYGADSVTYAKIQNVSATDRILGRDTAGAGDIEELTVSGGLEFTGTGIQRSALVGDVTASAGTTTTTIAPDSVTFAKMQNITSDRLLGRDTASSGDPEEIPLAGGLQFTGGPGLRAFQWICIVISDETTAITTGIAKRTLRLPACTVLAVRASLTTVSSSGNPTFDINKGVTSILGTKLSIDSGEKTSTTAASAATITDSSIADDAEITVDIDTAGTGATGAKIYMQVVWT